MGTTTWNGKVQWAKGTDNNLIEPNASGVQNDMKAKGYEVTYYHAADIDPQRSTNYVVKLTNPGPGIPEQPKMDWDAAVARVHGAKSVYFQPDGKVGHDV